MRRPGPARSPVVRKLGYRPSEFDDRVELPRVVPSGLEACEAHGQRIQVGAYRTASGEHRFDQDRSRSAEGIEDRRSLARQGFDEARRGRRMEPSRISVEAVNVLAVGLIRSSHRGRRNVECTREPRGDLAVSRDGHLSTDVCEGAPALRGVHSDGGRAGIRLHGRTIDVPGGGVNRNCAAATGSFTRGLSKSKRFRFPCPSMTITRRTWDVAAST